MRQKFYILPLLSVCLILAYSVNAQVVISPNEEHEMENGVRKVLQHTNEDRQEAERIEDEQKLLRIRNKNLQYSNTDESILVNTDALPVLVPVFDEIDSSDSAKVKYKTPKYQWFKPKSVEGDVKGLKVAPANDLPCNATSVATDGSCSSQVGGNQDATGDYYGGCVQPWHNSIWYSFDVTDGNDYLNIQLDAPDGKEMEAMLFQGDCTGSPDGDFISSPTLIQTNCGISPFAFEFFDVPPGTYYLQFSTQPGSNLINTTFNICFLNTVAPTFVTGPEQDCPGAIPVCDLVYVQENSYTDFWVTDEIPVGANCLYGGENNSVWYVFTPGSNGDLEFTLETTNDYDWAIWDITSIGGCENVGTSAPVRCNYSGTDGNTGISSSGVSASVDQYGLPWSTILPVTEGNTYVLLVDNYTGDGTGYTLDFSASTASIADNPPATGAYPLMDAAAASCGEDEIMITMSELVKCLSIVESDFTLTNTTTSTDFTSAITSVSGLNCDVNALTYYLIFTHDGTLTTGDYEIAISATPTLADKCDNLVPASTTVAFSYLASLTLTASTSTICSGGSVDFNADGADGSPSLVTYTFNPGGLTNNTDGVFTGFSPMISTLYTVSASYGGCTNYATASVTVEGNIMTSISPTYKSLCNPADNTNLTATTLVNGSACADCSYLWSTTETDAVITVGVGTYTVTATTGTGCSNSNSPSSTVEVVSAGTGGGSCDVIYVSPAGGGDGYTKDAPTDIMDAITKAQCTNAIIKMMVGVYSLTDYIPIHDYVTLEGGYDSDFLTKSSNMAGDANSTTIRRSNAGDSDDGTKCSAFVVDGGATDFRLQDLRMELPGCSSNPDSHSPGDNKTNYGIRLGSGCTNYNIVRCYIDAGIGSDPTP